MLYLALRTEKKKAVIDSIHFCLNWPCSETTACVFYSSTTPFLPKTRTLGIFVFTWKCVHMNGGGVSFGINLHIWFTWVCFVIVWEFLLLLSGDGFLFVCLLLARGYMVGWGCLGREFQESAHFLFPRTGIKGMTATSCFSFLHFFNSILF